jgi:glycosyltransferase involved in cell wall biosynthesis
MTAATVIIATRERRVELRRAIESALMQTAKPEVLVIDDASTDGTSEMVQKEFPEVRLHASEKAAGYIHQRNNGARLASGEIVFSIDDDATFSTPNIVEATLNEFGHPRVGAVGIPFVDVNRSSLVRQQAPSRQGVYATYSYIGTAHALRRELFVRLSGYRASLYHQGEEEDYCIRMLNAGYITRCGNSDPIYHFESPRRSFTRMDYYGARNKILFAWQNIPLPEVTWHLPATTVKTLLYALRPDRFWTRFRGVVAAYALCAGGHARRRPVAQSTYRLSRLLKTRGPMPLEEITPSLPQPNLIAHASCEIA